MRKQAAEGKAPVLDILVSYEGGGRESGSEVILTPFIRGVAGEQRQSAAGGKAVSSSKNVADHGRMSWWRADACACVCDDMVVVVLAGRV